MHREAGDFSVEVGYRDASVFSLYRLFDDADAEAGEPFESALDGERLNGDVSVLAAALRLHELEGFADEGGAVALFERHSEHRGEDARLVERAALALRVDTDVEEREAEREQGQRQRGPSSCRRPQRRSGMRDNRQGSSGRRRRSV